jgi:MFS family permease
MNAPRPMLDLRQLLICSAILLTFSMGIRHGFGLWLQPMTQAMSWGREDFSMAIAVQNLTWGLAGIFSGMLADRFGAFRVIVMGVLFYALGLLGMANATTPLSLVLSAGVLIGMAQAGTTYVVVYGIVGRNTPVEKRSWAMGVTAAAGSFGQFLMMPIEGFLITHWGWQQALLALAAMILLMLPLSLGLREPAFSQGQSPQRDQTIVQALREAMAYRSFQWLMAGFFVCGFQVVFIGVHLPSYLKDKGLSPEVAGYALALIGLFNVFGTYAVGLLGSHFSGRQLLAFNYLARSVVISIFLWAPLSNWSVYLFACFMGLLWLSTVPPTNGTVAKIFGLSHFSMLGGSVFFGHQVGSFLGVWLGGWLYDHTGSYDVVWYIAIALGVVAAVFNLQVDEKPIERVPQPQGAAA